MVLPDFVLSTRANQRWQYSGLDSHNRCLDKRHFKSYPYDIEYVYNSRGFRDEEWPATTEELKQSIWCVGDSFTVGIGSPLEHTWPYQVSQQLKQRTINVSMDGASNQWIARKALDIINKIQPKLVIIQWSYIHRYELDDITLCDEDRRMKFGNNFYNDLAMSSQFIKLIQQPEFSVANPTTKVIHSFIPKFGIKFDVQDMWNQIRGEDWPDLPADLEEFKALEFWTVDELTNFFNLYDQFNLHYNLYHNINYIPETTHLDLARDGHHYDILTAQKFGASVRQLVLDRLS